LKNLVTVVVPVYYNAASLPLLKERLFNTAATIPEIVFEFIFVDDCSGDNSFEVLRELAEGDDRVRIIRFSRNFGSNASIQAGLAYARGDCAVVITADLQDPPELIPELYAAWKEGNQVVLASRRNRGDPLISKFSAAVFNHLFRRLVFRDFPPSGFDFMLIDRQVINVLVESSEKNSHIFGQTMWVGFKRRVIYYDRGKRIHGRSRWTIAKKIKYFIDAFTAFSYLPLRVATVVGIFLAGLGFLYALLIIGLRLTVGLPIVGWASLAVVVLITSGAQFILVGVLGEYLWRVLDEVRHRPSFIVESLVNLDGPRAVSHHEKNPERDNRSEPDIK